MKLEFNPSFDEHPFYMRMYCTHCKMTYIESFFKMITNLNKPCRYCGVKCPTPPPMRSKLESL